MPAIIACRTDPMPLTIAIRQDPRVWKSDSICISLQVSEAYSGGIWRVGVGRL